MPVTRWTAVGVPAPPGAESISISEFVTVLSGQRDRLIPFVGAGLAVGAGAPSGTDLIGALLIAAGEPALPGADFFGTVDRLAAEHGEEWVHRTVAETVNRSERRPTPTLTALAKAATRLVITTNYDDAIEVSARAAGIKVVPATVHDFRPALGTPGDALVVMHLHGVASDPASIVLTEDSYQRGRTRSCGCFCVPAGSLRVWCSWGIPSRNGRPTSAETSLGRLLRACRPASNVT